METNNDELNLIFTASSYFESTIVDPDLIGKKIQSSLNSILSNEFSDENKRMSIVHSDRISFACVYCGDSVKDTRKKRGNLFLKTLQYHCFNGDCNAHKSIYDFFNEKKCLDSFTMDEQSYLKNSSNAHSLNLKQIKAAMGLETFLSDDIYNLSISREFLMNKLKLKEIKGSRIENYLRDRLQTDHKKFGWDQKNGVLYVFNLTHDFERVIGLQIKTFNKRNPYLTWKTTKIHQELEIYKEENQPILEKMDFLSNIFGIFQVDLNKTITVFEGPLDSFLFPNSIALCSAKNSLPFEIEGARYFYDNDQTGKEWSVRRITDGKSAFLWRKYLHDNELMQFQSKIKDLNDLLIYIKKSGKECKKFSDYFSDSKYDIIYV